MLTRAQCVHVSFVVSLSDDLRKQNPPPQRTGTARPRGAARFVARLYCTVGSRRLRAYCVYSSCRAAAYERTGADTRAWRRTLPSTLLARAYQRRGAARGIVAPVIRFLRSQTSLRSPRGASPTRRRGRSRAVSPRSAGARLRPHRHADPQLMSSLTPALHYLVTAFGGQANYFVRCTV